MPFSWRTLSIYPDLMRILTIETADANGAWQNSFIPADVSEFE
jgi:hypothetical protein